MFIFTFLWPEIYGDENIPSAFWLYVGCMNASVGNTKQIPTGNASHK